MKVNNCFYCLNADHKNGINVDGEPGWYYPCNLDIENQGLENISSCEKYSMNHGFQMGGYYTHMHFEIDGCCLQWVIHGDGENPKNDKNDWSRVHICDFRQIEEWVKVWGKELRARGWINEENDN